MDTRSGSTTTPSPAQRVDAVRQAIAQACGAGGRATNEVTLIAVSKTRSADEIRNLAGFGLQHFAENYLQEARSKQQALADVPLVWHFIGPIQSNKTRDLAAHFDWVHSVDRLKVARRLAEQRPAQLPPLNVCLQVNIDDEASKSGASLAEIPALATAVAALPRLRLRGLMAIPDPQQADRGAAAFQRLAMTLQQLAPTIPGLDTLSMGMSDDFDLAIAAGATHIRVGTALFGPRPAKDISE